MAAPMRSAFLTKFPHFSSFYSGASRNSLLKRQSHEIFKAQMHTGKEYLPNRGSLRKSGPSKNGKWTKSGVLIATAGVATAVSFGYLLSPSVEVVKNCLCVSAADKLTKPEHRISREVRRSTDETGLKLTLYQYQTCPFCCKVRAFLDYHGMSYNIVEVNSVTRKQLKWTPYPKVPVLVVDGVGENGFLQLNDSSTIISILKTYLFHRNNKSPRSLDQLLKCYPVMENKEKRKTVYEFPNKYFIMYFDEKADKDKETYKEEREWRAWTDNTFVHVLSPNIYRTPAEAYRAFQYFSKVGNWEKEFSTVERAVVVYVGSVAMYFIGKMLKRKYKLEDDVRQSLYKEARVWMKAKGSYRTYMGGEQPNLADLAVYGALVAIEGCESFDDLMQNTNISPWYNNMKQAVSSHSGYKLAASIK